MKHTLLFPVGLASGGRGLVSTHGSTAVIVHAPQASLGGTQRLVRSQVLRKAHCGGALEFRGYLRHRVSLQFLLLYGT